MGKATAAQARGPGFFRRGAQFFVDSWAELRKVVWPSRTEAWRFTMVVLFAVVLVSLFIFTCDWLLTQLTRPLFK